MLKMTGVSKAYRSEVLEIFALREISIHVREEEFVAVTGPSGSGKTTFLAIAGMLDAFTRGEYELDGVNVYRMGDHERSRLRNEKIGFIFQSFNLLNDLTVLDNIDMPLRYRGLTAVDRQRRVASALLADEPTGNLDEEMAKRVMDLLQELHREGATIVVVTHSADMTRRAEREIRIVDGSIVQHPLLACLNT